jgi:hypothetical protein
LDTRFLLEQITLFRIGGILPPRAGMRRQDATDTIRADYVIRSTARMQTLDGGQE